MDWALRYAKLGYKIFPVVAGGKRPVCKNGVKDATVDEPQIRQWFTRGDCNIGMSAEGLLAIDLDFLKGSTKSKDELQVDLDAARVFYDDGSCHAQKTRSGGLHVVYRIPQRLVGLLKNSTKFERHGNVDIDLRTTGGYIVVAPSFVEADEKAGAGRYTWKRELVAIENLPFPPQRVIDKLAIVAGKNNPIANGGDDVLIDRARNYLAKMPESVSGQGGHNCLLSAATALTHGFGLDADITKDLLGEFNERCSPCWSEKEIDHKIAEAMRTEHPSEKGHLARKNGQHPKSVTTTQTDAGKSTRRHEITLASEVVIKPVSWLWKYRFLDSKFSIISGEGGKGKSTFLCYVSATVSTGRNWIDGESCQRGCVVYLRGEDDADSVLVPRLKVADADLEKIAIHRQTQVLEGGQWVEDDDITVRNVDAIEEIINDSERKTGVTAKLFILDPFSEFLGDTKENNNKDMRNATRRLRNYAEKKGIAIIGIEHHNKSVTGSAQHRVTGSQAKTSMSRSTWGVYDDPENEGWLLFAKLKNNHKVAKTIRFQLVDSDIPDIAKIEFGAVDVDMTADNIELATQRKQAETIRNHDQKPLRLEQAKGFLQDFLSDGRKPAGSAENPSPGSVFRESGQAGHTWGTILRAEKMLGIIKTKDLSVSFWALPGMSRTDNSATESLAQNTLAVNPLAQVGVSETGSMESQPNGVSGNMKELVQELVQKHVHAELAQVATDNDSKPEILNIATDSKGVIGSDGQSPVKLQRRPKKPTQEPETLCKQRDLI